MSGIRALVVEQREVIRCGLTTMLQSIPEVSRCLSASTITAIGEDDLRSLDVVLISTQARGELEKARSSGGRPARVIAVIPRAEPQQFETASQMRAHAYVIQDRLSADHLRSVLLNLVDEHMTMPPEMATYLLNRTTDGCEQGGDREQVAAPVPLNPREQDVLDLMVIGSSNKEIAVKLGISIHSVKRHVSCILNKFNSPSRVHLVSRLLRSRVVSS